MESGKYALADGSIEFKLEIELACIGLVLERARDALDQIREINLVDIDGDRAGLDLGKVENITDQVQEIRSCAVDRLCEFNLPC